MHALKSKSNLNIPNIDYSQLTEMPEVRSAESVDVRKLLKSSLNQPLSEITASNRLTETDSSFFTKQAVNKNPVHHMLS